MIQSNQNELQQIMQVVIQPARGRRLEGLISGAAELSSKLRFMRDIEAMSMGPEGHIDQLNRPVLRVRCEEQVRNKRASLVPVRSSRPKSKSAASGVTSRQTESTTRVQPCDGDDQSSQAPGFFRRRPRRSRIRFSNLLLNRTTKIVRI